MRISFFLFLLLVTASAFAQRENNVWYFGYRAGLDFNGGAPVTLSDGETRTYEGTASVADPTTGELLFYTTGDSVWNRQHRLMPNGTGLGGHWSSSQSALIVPDPGNSLRYYIFTTDAGPYIDGTTDGLHYAVVDMRADGGRGDVVEKGYRLLAMCAEKLTAVPTCTGDGYWVLAHDLFTDAFYAFRVNAGGPVLTPVVSRVGFVPGATCRGVGYMKASPDGRLLAVAYEGENHVDVLEFDNGTGIVSHAFGFSSPGPYGLSFSPDSRQLYVSRYNVFYVEQWDLSRYDPAFVTAARTVLTPWSLVEAYALQLAPDGKIYVAVTGRQLGVIERPDVSGWGCGLHLGGPQLGVGYCLSGLPNMIDAAPGLEPPTVSVDGDADICIGEELTLRASGGTRYYWSEGGTVLCADCESVRVAPTTTTTYAIDIITASGCNVHDSVTVRVHPKPTIAVLPNDTVICPGESVQLMVAGGTTYQWQPADGLSCTDCPNPHATPARTTTYTVIGTSEFGCTGSASLTVVVRDVPRVDAGSDAAICSGDSALLNVSSGKSYRWSPSTGLSCTDCRSPMASPSATTLYTAVVEGWGGCVGSDTVRVSVLSPEDISAGDDVAICSGDSTQLSAQGEGRFLWTPGDGLSCIDCRAPVASPKQTTTYHLTVRSDGGCSVQDSVTVTVLPLPVVDAGRSQTICRGGSVQLEASEGAAHAWFPATGLSCTGCRNPVAALEQTTLYRVTVTDANGCRGDDTVRVRVVDEATVDAGEGEKICAGDTVQLSASEGAAYRWSPADGLSCADCRDPKAGPAVSTLYSVTVTTGSGCVGTDTVRVDVLPAVDAGEGGAICAGESFRLSATDAELYAWSPDEGLNCTDCRAPVATPSRTTTYYLRAESGTGCRSIDSVTVIVREPHIVRARIGGERHIVPGGRLTLPIVLDDPVADPGDTITIRVGYDAGMFRLHDMQPDATLLDRWQVDELSDMPGEIFMRLIASSLAGPIDSGSIVQLAFDAFLGDLIAGHVSLNVDLHAPCLRVESSGTEVQLDSICGLSGRLIEFSAEKYALEQNDPNPFNPTTRIRFSLPFDGAARLEVFNATGERVAVLVNDVLAAGAYEAVWDAGSVPSGLYYYRLQSGSSSLTRQMIVVK